MRAERMESSVLEKRPSSGDAGEVDRRCKDERTFSAYVMCVCVCAQATAASLPYRHKPLCPYQLFGGVSHHRPNAVSRTFYA